ncbi:hypothetical protein [Terriglobus saanensis]|uniref:Oxidoreductase domain-containing protein n=1 Tax=Terriglobus saanensis (strain ATCC BAA-1853 / DSM 23119 / SP1PR4) TaxID=401053 RepID=E8V2P0_TERSS|nr:hypothetical protein [Terriglobus saanensis]ADV83515.1 oxidoreductase domain-containing protein [Terriglobus saanensis SP1PR4]
MFSAKTCSQQTRSLRKAFVLTAVLLAYVRSDAAHAQDLKLGILGTDSSHAVEFTRILNDPSAMDHVAGAKIVVAYRGGSPTLPFSRDRIVKFTETLQKTWSIPFVPSMVDLCTQSDAILVLSVDTSARMRELGEAVKCKKPIFIDKPLGGTLADALQVAKFLDEQHIPWFSTSSLRYGHEQRPANVVGAETWGPGKYIEGFPLDLTYYGIHSIESLFSIMGPGVQQVARTRVKDTDVITAIWTDGRMGTVRLIHPESTYGAVIFREGGHAEPNNNLQVGYGPLVTEIVKFARTSKPPVSERETLEIFAVMDAAQQSLQKNGAFVQVVVPEIKKP